MGVHQGLVLIVEDDEHVRSALADILGDVGIRVIEAGTGSAARAMVAELAPDVVLLDLGLPDASGLDILQELVRAEDSPSVIVLSNRSGVMDRVVGLDLGADDYISKPFSSREVLARVGVALRRKSADVESETTIDFGDLRIGVQTREVLVDGEPRSLTAREFDVLVYMAESPRRVFTRDQLLRAVWGSSSQWQDHATVGEHIHRIRRKLDAKNRRRFIETVRGVGYRFVHQPESDPSDRG